MMFLVILLGWLARRRGYLADATMSVMNRFVIDMAFPALVFTQMLRTVDGATLRAGWYVPLLAAGLIVLTWIVGVASAPLFASGKERSTFVFCVAIPNWVFLPLPIADALFGDDGVRVILLANVGAQLVLWSLGVWIFHAHLSWRQTVRQIVTNAGLIATIAGVVVALAAPQSRTWETLKPAGATLPSLTAGATLPSLTAGAAVQALVAVGSLTVPLQLLVIGAQLGGMAARIHKPSRALIGAAVLRLIVAPAITLTLAWVAMRCGLVLPETTRMCLYLIAAMPVAISAALFTEQFGGDVPLGAQGIFYSTFFSILTVPVFFYVIARLGL
jgi:predicted permease